MIAVDKTDFNECHIWTNEINHKYLRHRRLSTIGNKVAVEFAKSFRRRCTESEAKSQVFDDVKSCFAKVIIRSGQ